MSNNISELVAELNLVCRELAALDGSFVFGADDLYKLTEHSAGVCYDLTVKRDATKRETVLFLRCKNIQTLARYICSELDKQKKIYSARILEISKTPHIGETISRTLHVRSIQYNSEMICVRAYYEPFANAQNLDFYIYSDKTTQLPSTANALRVTFAGYVMHSHSRTVFVSKHDAESDLFFIE